MHDMDRQHHHQGFDEEEIEEQVIVDDHQGGHQTMDEDYGDFLDVPYEDEEEEHEIYDEEDSNFPNQNNVNGPRAGKSLGRLTQRFIRYLQNAPTGMVDLNVASIKIRQKVWLSIFNYFLLERITMKYLGGGKIRSYSKTQSIRHY